MAERPPGLGQIATAARAWKDRCSTALLEGAGARDGLHSPKPTVGTAMAKAGCMRWLNEQGTGQVPLAGGKPAPLEELFQRLNRLGVHVPDGFTLHAGVP